MNGVARYPSSFSQSVQGEPFLHAESLKLNGQGRDVDEAEVGDV
ncbi:hypothetical protein [Mycobacteroides abscessus]|nr:hypothetical protein [Mycobacteroides abscessus]